MNYKIDERFNTILLKIDTCALSQLEYNTHFFQTNYLIK